jgi:branched-chain amino acid transport system ATP-binding protein
VASVDRTYVLRTGKVIMRGTAAETRENPEIRKAYLGLLTTAHG